MSGQSSSLHPGFWFVILFTLENASFAFIIIIDHPLHTGICYSIVRTGNCSLTTNSTKEIFLSDIKGKSEVNAPG